MMNIIKRDFEQVKNLDKLKDEGYKFQLIFYLDNISCGEIDNGSLDEDKLIEARIFCEDKEIHIFENEGFKAVECIDEKDQLENENSYIEKQLLIDRFGKELSIKRYIKFDEDGQAYISYTRLCNWIDKRSEA